MAFAMFTMASFHIDFNKYERELFLTCYATFEITTEALDVALVVTTIVPDEIEKILTLLRPNLGSWNEVGPLPRTKFNCENL